MKFYFPNKKNQKLIPLGIDAHFYDPSLFEYKKDNEAVLNIITVANLVPIKGIEVLIKAIHQLNNPLIHLEILGDTRAPYAKVLQQLVLDLKLQNQVQLLGKHPDVRPFLAQSDLYVIPTLDVGEGMPMALVEAMSMGVPVLGSNITGINYVLQDFPALMFEANSAASLSDKITSFYAKSYGERKAIGTSLREYCIENFSMQKFIQEHEELYLKLSKKNR